MKLEESMEEKPVRKSNWLAVASLCLGVLGFITSMLFLWILHDLFIPNLDDSFFPEWLASVFEGIVTSSFLGLTGISLGIISFKKTTGSNWTAKAGIIFGVMAILGGFPLMWFVSFIGLD